MQNFPFFSPPSLFPRLFYDPKADTIFFFLLYPPNFFPFLYNQERWVWIYFTPFMMPFYFLFSFFPSHLHFLSLGFICQILERFTSFMKQFSPPMDLYNLFTSVNNNSNNTYPLLDIQLCRDVLTGVELWAGEGGDCMAGAYSTDRTIIRSKSRAIQTTNFKLKF